MPQSILTQTLVKEFMQRLETAGRDWHRIKSAIRGLEREVQLTAWGEPWSSELSEYLTQKSCDALALAIEESIRLEEFEWAHEIEVRLRELEKLGYTKKIEGIL